MSDLIHDHINRARLALRQRIWSRIRFRSGQPALAHGPAADRENAFYRLVLERALEPKERVPFTTVWDIGCRNWSYAPAVAAAFPNAELIGVELDGDLLHPNLYRRRDVVAAQIAELQKKGRRASIHFQDFRSVQSASDPSSLQAFCFFYPFVSKRPCLKWGLPTEYADYHSLLEHTQNLAQNPLILSLHQGEWESELAHDAYRHAGFQTREKIIAPSQFSHLWPSTHPAHIIVTSRQR